MKLQGDRGLIYSQSNRWCWHLGLHHRLRLLRGLAKHVVHKKLKETTELCDQPQHTNKRVEENKNKVDKGVFPVIV